MLTLAIREAQGGFFDRQRVIKALDRANRKALSKAGAFIRQRAKTSIRKRKRSAPPGQPPHSHVGHLRKFMYFAYDQHRRSVVVGPAKINRPGRAPALLEHGGRDRTGNFYRGNPYMGPALRAELPNLPSHWKNSVRAS